MDPNVKLTEFGLIRNLAMDDQDVGHLCKLDTRGSLLDLLQELAQDNFTPERQETVTVSFLEYSRLRRGEQRVRTCEEKRGIKVLTSSESLCCCPLRSGRVHQGFLASSPGG